jgi:hypothetical protein
VWSPTPVARITFFKVRCFIIDVDSPSRYSVNFQLLKRSISQFFNDAALLHLPDRSLGITLIFVVSATRIKQKCAAL